MLSAYSEVIACAPTAIHQKYKSLSVRQSPVHYIIFAHATCFSADCVDAVAAKQILSTHISLTARPLRIY